MSEKTLSAGRSALLLTILSAVSQVLFFLYRVALSRLVGAEVMGLYQLLMPVYSVLLSLTSVGLTAAVSNLTAQRLALGDSRGAAQTLSSCLRCFLLLALLLGAAVIPASDFLSVRILGDARTQLGLILLAPCVVFTGVENLHKHFFYGAGLVLPPAAADLLEQLVRTAAVLGLLVRFLPQYPERALGLIVSGMVLCEIVSAMTLALLYRSRQKRRGLSGPGETAPVRRRRIAAIALPMGLNALLGNLMGAVNSTLIPQMLVAGGLPRREAVSQFGVVCGMTLPMLALPTVFLGAFHLVLLPRLARSCALGQTEAVRRLSDRAMSAAALLTLPSMSLMVVLGPDLGRLLFHQEGVGDFLLPLAVTMGLSCFCSVLGAILNGVGRQRTVAAVSLLGGAVQLLFTLLLVPRPGLGMAGYVAGAVISTALELCLLLRAAVRRAGLVLRPFPWFAAPGLASLLAALTSNLLFRHLKGLGLSLLPAGGAALSFALVLYLAALSAQGISVGAVLRLRKP